MANQYVNKVAVNGQTVLDLSGDTVYPGMLAKGITAHDKSGAQITGTLEVPATEERTVELSMPSGNQVILPTSGKVMRKVTVQKPATLLSENIKKDVVIGGVTGALEAGGGSVQPSKSVSITQNGTTTITPDTGYDALGKVEISVNVASGGGGGETTQLQVNVSGSDIEAPLFCLWQTSDGWMGTANFDSATAFTIPNVIVGGYAIFTHDPGSEYYFSVSDAVGVEDIGVGAMDAEWDIPNAALVMKVTALSPSFIIRLLNR